MGREWGRADQELGDHLDGLLRRRQSNTLQASLAQRFQPRQRQGLRDKPLLEGGVRLGYNRDYGKREIALYGRNITNKLALSGAIDFNNRTGFVNEPRVIGVEFRAEL